MKQWSSVLLLFYHRQVHIVVLGFAPDAETPGLHVREYDAHELAERSRIQDRHTLGTALLCIAAIYTVTSHRPAAPPAILPQPADR